MSASLGFKRGLDIPTWRQLSQETAIVTAGMGLAWDHRNDISRIPNIYLLRSATALDVYDPGTDDWMPLASPALAGSFGAGATAIMHPSQGPRGTLAAGWSTTSGALTTALPAAVGSNQLKRLDGVGFRIRIYGKASGKTNTRTIIANTAGTTPTITLDSPLEFTPAAGDAYEILSGRVYLLSAGTLAAGIWKYYDIATNSYSGNLATTNLPTIGTDTSGIAFSELHVPCDRAPGEGFVSGGATYDTTPSAGYTSKNCIQATAADATHITGSGMPADLHADEYRNFQIRIVEDVSTPTAVGQRAVITTHASGAAGQFTVASWPTATPSASAKFVVENNDNLILLRSSATNSFYAYNVGSDSWSTTLFTAGGATASTGVIFEQAFGIARSGLAGTDRRHSHCFALRGGASNTIDMLDIAGGANGSVSADIAYGNKGQTFTTGTCGAYDPVTLGGKYMYINVNGTQRMARFDMLNQIMVPDTFLVGFQTTATVGQKAAMSYSIDGANKLSALDLFGNSVAAFYQKINQF